MKSALFGLFLLNTVMANDIIASKHDNSIYYSSCLIEPTVVTRVKNIGRNRKAIQATTHGQNLNDLISSSSSLLSSISGGHYRWSPIQTDYYIANVHNELTLFYAVGFNNINNESELLTKSLNTIDQLCDAVALDFSIIGEFQLDLKIGNRIFVDYLNIERTPLGHLKGKYVVPNSFESAIDNLQYENGSFSFTIHVKEGTDDYHAVFEGLIDENDRVIGKAFILPERKPLGEFTGKRIK